MNLREFISTMAALSILATIPSFADETVAPTDGKNWGDDNAAQNMLQMTRDPRIIREEVSPRQRNEHIASSCEDAKGHLFTEDDPGYERCRREMKRPRP